MSSITPPTWVSEAIFYQIFPDRFAIGDHSAGCDEPLKPSNLEPWDSPPTSHGFKGGDLWGICERLDYLADLGITALYLNPVFRSAANHRYHTLDYYQVDPILGGDEALRALLDAAHARHMRVVLDGVFNHTGRGFYAFHHALENGAASPYLDWFHIDVDRLRAGRPLNAYPDAAALDGLQADKAYKELGYRAWWGLPALPVLNTETPAVRGYLLDVARHWIEFGADGWRLDVPGEIDDEEFWRAFRRTVKEANADAYIVGEVWDDGTRWLQGDQFDGLMNYVLNRACLGFFGADGLDTDQRPGGFALQRLDAAGFASEVERMLGQHPWAFTQAQLNLLGSHDTARFLTLTNGDREALKLAVLFLMTFPGAPCIYYGDEIGMTGGPDPDCRGAFPWDADRWDHDLLDWCRRASEMRHGHRVLRQGRFQSLLTEDHLYAFCRTLAKTDDETAVVVLNGNQTAANPRVPVSECLQEGMRLHDVWGTGGLTRVRDGQIETGHIPARSAQVWVNA